MNKTWPLIVVFFLMGCSNKIMYDNIQTNNRNDCNKVPASQYEACIERTKKSYEEYEQDRKKI